MRVFLRRRDAPWEVVDHKSVQPVPTFYDDEDVDIIHLSSAETRGTYVFESHSGASSKRSSGWASQSTRSGAEHGRKALIFARQQLLREVAKKDCNVLLLEGWSLTVLRKGKRVRFEVQYSGRGALAAGKPDIAHRQPPFIELLGPA
ncbi:uncharacterized protein FOMMEDRAFT_83102 [Fomitiporia mediterranea MF3/22]|uniref:uncharacterized protein n=1 Tax=Fomitiporia mediterranea (strain MF3/22) TaxID=694068 RepID=UPI0004409BF5|nr:uncharacterized protein FOMMEDRAFT_83102 [Fomitiporia mediterranea MF3/22]EJD04365.1 hypothetical protein FOMMEDRAFT_83102 [Fomitiporia mediterranea MF3/22]